MRISRPTGLLACGAVCVAALAFGPQPRARAEVNPLADAMSGLSTRMEDALHWLVRGDFVELEHVGIELVRAVDRTMTIAQMQGLAPELLDGLVDMREDAEDLREEAREQRLHKAGKAYVKLVEACMSCHTETQ